MNKEIKYTENRGQISDILYNLRNCDCYFNPKLSLTVSLEIYSEKLFEKSERFEAWHENRLIGLAAIYCNDDVKFEGYITYVSVMKAFNGLKIGRTLVEKTIEGAVKNKMKLIKLEVSSQSYIAVSLYKKLGFFLVSESNDKRLMQLNLMNLYP